MKCPKCNKDLTEQDIFVYKNDGSYKKVGREQFCRARGCTYQKDVKMIGGELNETKSKNVNRVSG